MFCGVCHPVGVNGGFGLFRGCRFAQPPAIGCNPAGCKMAQWSCGDKGVPKWSLGTRRNEALRARWAKCNFADKGIPNEEKKYGTRSEIVLIFFFRCVFKGGDGDETSRFKNCAACGRFRAETRGVGGV